MTDAVLDRKGKSTYNLTKDLMDEVAGERSVHRPAAERPALEWLRQQALAVTGVAATPAEKQTGHGSGSRE